MILNMDYRSSLKTKDVPKDVLKVFEILSLSEFPPMNFRKSLEEPNTPEKAFMPIWVIKPETDLSRNSCKPEGFPGNPRIHP
jgi:hypothetical protein